MNCLNLNLSALVLVNYWDIIKILKLIEVKQRIIMQALDLIHKLSKD